LFLVLIFIRHAAHLLGMATNIPLANFVKVLNFDKVFRKNNFKKGNSTLAELRNDVCFKTNAFA
jgi:hypothetical protein